MTSFRRLRTPAAPALSGIQRDLQHRLHTVPPHDGGDAETKAVQPVLALEQNGDGEHGPLIPDDALGNAGHSHSDPIVGGPLAADDLIGAVPHLAVDAVQPGPSDGPAAGRSGPGRCWRYWRCSTPPAHCPRARREWRRGRCGCPRPAPVPADISGGRYPHWCREPNTRLAGSPDSPPRRHSEHIHRIGYHQEDA